eukprot:SAG22_NODE_1526_length_4224_cov_3.171394_4_plen_198_part_00
MRLGPRRLLYNTKARARGDPEQSTRYLSRLGRRDNQNYEMLPDRLDLVESFDVVLFREYTLVSNMLAWIQRIHGADLFSHVGIVLKAPVLPDNTEYLPSGSIAQAGEFGNIPFIQLKMRFEEPAADDSSGGGGGGGGDARVLVVTVLRVVRLPDDLDEGLGGQDPYVKVGLEPWCEGFYEEADPDGQQKVGTGGSCE